MRGCLLIEEVFFFCGLSPEFGVLVVELVNLIGDVFFYCSF